MFLMNALRMALMNCRAKWVDSKTEFVNLEFEEFGLVVEPNTLKSMGE